MVRFWYERIQGDINRIDEVPMLWRDAVKEKIEGELQCLS